MNDLDSFKKNNPNTPIGEFIEETISVPEHKYDPNTGRMTIVNKLEKQKTMYVHAPKESMRCKNGEHEFIPSNPSKGMFSCTKCPFRRQVSPTRYRYDEASKSLINRFTSQKI